MNHRHAGFRANGMGVWQVPEDRVEEIGDFFSKQQPITHCYLRPTYPDWPYNIFTMVHSKKVTAKAAQTAPTITLNMEGFDGGPVEMDRVMETIDRAMKFRPPMPPEPPEPPEPPRFRRGRFERRVEIDED